MSDDRGEREDLLCLSGDLPKPHKENRSLTVRECVKVPPVTTIPFKSAFSQFVQAVKENEPSYKHSQVKSNHYGESVICARLNVPISLL